MITFQNVTLAYSRKSFADKSLKTRLIDPKRHNMYKEDIFALSEISLQISKGNRIALIGDNGAGKTTFLKAIAGIYPISSGQLIVKGNVRSLFELNLGFEIDATGRENIAYRALLMGGHPNDLNSIKESVIAFSELGDRIDFPIRTYSSGMMVKLAFSISTAFPGEILLMDEFISAGDFAFLNKARERLLEFINESKVLVVATHDFALAREICNRAIWLERGRVVMDGAINEVIDSYIAEKSRQ